MIEFSNVSVCIDKKYLLKNINLNLLTQGFDVSFIIGNNGAGKSSLIKLLFNLLKYQGEIKRVSNLSFAGDIGDIDSSFAIDDIIKYSALNTGPAFASIDDVLDLFDLTHLKTRDFQSLSGGEKKRVLLACSVYQKSDVIIWDEPTNFLDPKHIKMIEKIINDLSGERKFLVITHDLNFMLNCANEVSLLKDGELNSFIQLNNIEDMDLSSKLSHLFEVPINIKRIEGKRIVLR